MRTPNEQLHNQVYIDYIEAIILEKPLRDVAKKNKCSEKLIQNIRHRKEQNESHRMAPSKRPQMWKNRYKHIQDLLDKKPDKALQDALIRRMYNLNGYSIKEITKYTGKGKVYVMDCLV